MVKKILKKITPRFLLSWYHYLLALAGAVAFGFPSRRLTVIGVTGTSGKSTTVDFITRILEEDGKKVASLSSVRFKVGQKEWKNERKMTMPGRFTIQKLLKQAVKDGCQFMVLEVTSEGIKQFRHKFINFDCAVFTNLSPEHIESHGTFEKYRNEKMKLFSATKNLHVINIDDQSAKFFLDVPAKKLVSFSLSQPANVQAANVTEMRFSVQGTSFQLNMLGKFNVANGLAAIATSQAYGVSLQTCAKALEKVSGIPGRMEVVSREPLAVVDYAHTPEQLEQAYQSLQGKPLVCVLGSCGGGRDKWKRPALGKIAGAYCKEVIITNEDPYDEDPWRIMEQVAAGIVDHNKKHSLVLDRKEAIKKAVGLMEAGDALIVTGKGSEVWMCLANGKKIAWDDRQIVREALAKTAA